MYPPLIFSAERTAMKRHGHFCRICQRRRPNEQFSGRGHRIHICKECQRLPKEKIDRIERLEELHGFLDQSNISAKNVERLKILLGHSDREVAMLAALLLEIASVLPGKHSRWRKLASRHRDVFDRAVRLLGVEFFEDLLGGYGDFENPVWKILEHFSSGSAAAWTGQPCSCGSGQSFRDCCMEREDRLADDSATSLTTSAGEKSTRQRTELPLIPGDGKRVINPTPEELDASLWGD